MIDPKDLYEMMDKMNFQINHLFETIEEFRKFFRPNTNLEVIKVKSIVDSTLLLLKDELMQYTIQVACEYEDENLAFMVNKNELIHVLINLIQNSKDAFLDNEIKDKNIYIAVSKNDTLIEIVICDNAGGIPDEVIDDVFTSHFTTKESKGGTGIGLYLVTQILDKINGKIQVENKNGGACFTISIPEKIYCEI
jgi:C4-dicarboxylate-specific signal transduction histidine kinase